MKRIYNLFFSLTLAFALQAQPIPCKWYAVCGTATWEEQIAANPKSTVLADNVQSELFGADGLERIYNALGNEITLAKYILKSTRVPSDAADLTAKAKIVYDDTYLYILLNVEDNNLVKNSFLGDAFEVQIAPYLEAPGKTSDAEKYSYWNDLGGRKLHFTLDNLVGESSRYPLFADIAPSESYLGCYAASADKASGTGYYALLMVNFWDAMANYVPATDAEITFELKVLDRDAGSTLSVQAAWNSDNNDSYATIIYDGKLKMTGVPVSVVGLDKSVDSKISMYPNPAKDVVEFGEVVKSVSISTIAGQLVAGAENTSSINVSGLPAGFYTVSIVAVDGEIANIVLTIE